MSQRIALRCPHCQMVSYRPAGFVRARLHFVCNYCHEMSKIDRHQLAIALARHQPVVDVETHALEPVSDGRGRTW
jgi:hypothetical protein